MAAKKIIAAQKNAKTGSFTVHVPKDATTGTFATKPKTTGRIVVRTPAKKSS